MHAIEYMVHYFNLEAYMTKENGMAAIQLLYYYTMLDGGSGGQTYSQY